MEVVTSNISCTTANLPNTRNSTPKLRSKTCQLHVFVTCNNDKTKEQRLKIQMNTYDCIDQTI
ncbi:hypothetical protein C9J12_28850 [Photobacterium frigidiphilum]|uniref:Uncharacterized protein n=1 Tax=Photobacterium frigidiphilum TaxID=264736 RepID=A0A2T3J651_9GAMM|nr:hypothetical protein C9J12_28850 [Photobacterium frigidiphilum]